MQPLDLESRRRLYAIVRDCPGLHFREIQRRSSYSTAVAEHNLHYLSKHGLLRVLKDRRNMRYYPISFSTDRSRVMNLLRQDSARRIIIELLIGECSFSGHVQKTSLSQASISGQLKRLEECKVVAKYKTGSCVYGLVDESEVIRLLITYRESFVDRIVDRVLESWEF